MEKKRKTWTEPKLTALVRRKPEEGILDGCKTGTGNGPSDEYTGCFAPGGACPSCQRVNVQT